MDFLIAFGIFIMGWFVREQYAIWKIRHIIKEVKQLEEPTKPSELRVTIEKHNDMFYMYSEETGCFLAQGTTREEIAKKLRQDYPKFTVVADPNNIKEVGFK